MNNNIKYLDDELGTPKPSNKKKSSGIAGAIKNNIFSLRGLIVVFLVLQIITVAALSLIINPSQLYRQYQNSRIVDKVASIADVNRGETPIIAEVTDPDALREENEIQAEVYKDAQEGDFVLGYSDKMVIYRPSSESIIYEGDSPAVVLQKNQQAILDEVVEAVKATGRVTDATAENTQFQVVQDPDTLRAEDNGQFFLRAKQGDIIAYFPKAKVVALYNIQDKNIVNIGSYATAISQ